MAAQDTLCSERVLSPRALSQYRRLDRAAKSGSLNPRIKAVLPRVIQKWQERGVCPPRMGCVNGGPNFNLPLASVIISPAEVLPLADVPLAAGSPVHPVLADGVRAFFRTADWEYYWVAHRLGAVMHLESVAELKLGYIKGRLGTLSPEIVGLSLADDMPYAFDLEILQQMVADGRLDPASLSEAEAFHFLVANEDGRAENFIRSNEGRIFSWDFDYAFTRGFAWQAGHPDFLGHIPPVLYTERFIRGLEALTNQQIRRAAAILPAGIQHQIAFRRDLMKEDIAVRGRSALLVDTSFPLDLDRE